MQANDAEQSLIYIPSSKLPEPDTRPCLTGAAIVYAQLLDICTKDVEHLVVFDINIRHRVIQRRIVAIGTLTGVETHPREVFKQAIVINAAAIIIAHNHPSGEVTPSRADVDLTSRLREAGELLGIPVVDHVIVSVGGYCSLAERTWK